MGPTTRLGRVWHTVRNGEGHVGKGSLVLVKLRLMDNIKMDLRKIFGDDRM
jgi:hypothetical protein